MPGRDLSTLWWDHDPLTAADADAAPFDLDVELAWTAIAIRRCGLDAEQVICRRLAKNPIECEIGGADRHVDEPSPGGLGEVAQPISVERAIARQFRAARRLLGGWAHSWCRIDVNGIHRRVRPRCRLSHDASHITDVRAAGGPIADQEPGTDQHDRLPPRDLLQRAQQRLEAREAGLHLTLDL